MADRKAIRAVGTHPNYTRLEKVNSAVDRVEGVANESDYSSIGSVLVAHVAGTPVVVAMAASTFLGRPAAGNTAALTKTQALSILNVEDGAEVNKGEQLAGGLGQVFKQVDGAGNLEFRRVTTGDATQLSVSESATEVSLAVLPAGIDIDELGNVGGAAPTDGQVLAYVAANVRYEPDTPVVGITDIRQDLTPQLGGDLDINGQDIISLAAVDLDITAGAGGDLNLTTSGGGAVNVNGNAVLEVDAGVPAEGDLLIYEGASGRYEKLARGTALQSLRVNAGGTDIEWGADAGEVNTASNLGAGIGVFDAKVGVDLQFRSIVSQNNRLTVALDAINDEVDLTVVEGNIDHDALANYVLGQHRIINDAGTSATELWSASKINTELGTKQAQDSDLDAIAALATVGLITRTGSGTATTRAIQVGSAKLTVTNGNGVSGDPSLDFGAVSLADLSDVTAKTGTGTTVVMDTSPTIVTPTIASFANAAHDHEDAAGGGTLAAAAIASGTLADARISESSVTQHALAVTNDSEVSGSTFPVSPSDGDVFFHTTHQEWFSFDNTNSVWLGPEQHTIFGKGGTGFNNEYLRCGDALGTAARGFQVPYDIAITGFTGNWTVSLGTGNIRVRRDGTDVLSTGVLSGTTFEMTSQYATYAASGAMAVFLDTLSAAISHPTIGVFWRRRET